MWKVTNGKNKSKKNPNHIYSLLLISLECISLVLLDLPCYHHKTEVVLPNVNISIHTSVIDSILFPKFFCDPIFVFYESFIRDTLNIGKGSYDYLWSSYSLGKSQNTWEASVANLELKEILFTKKDKPTFIRNQFSLELLWFL